LGLHGVPVDSIALIQLPWFCLLVRVFVLARSSRRRARRLRNSTEPMFLALARAVLRWRIVGRLAQWSSLTTSLATDRQSRRRAGAFRGEIPLKR
jgi:hypothetical protein